MKSYDYIKQAADALRQAAAMRKLETDELRREITVMQEEERNYLNDLKNEERDRLINAGRQESDFAKAEHLSRARMIRTRESQVQQDYNKQIRDMTERMNNMQKSVDSLNVMAQNLARQSSQ